MRNKITFVLLVTFFVLLSTSCNDKRITEDELPQKVKTFIKQSVPGLSISYAQKDWGIFGTEYNVMLSDSTKVDFDSNNVWEEIENKAGVNPELIPATVAAYLNTRFPGIAATVVSKERYGFKVELVNDVEIKLNEQGALIEMDD